MIEPIRSDCVRAGCGHSSDVHVHWVPARVDRISVTDSAGKFPCELCGCPSMVRSEQNYAALVAEVPR